MPSVVTRGVLFVHGVPKAMCFHVEEALAAIFGAPARLDWTNQPAVPGYQRAEITWHGRAGTGAQIVSAMRGWERIRFEVTEEPSFRHDGSRWSYTPSLGIFHTQIDSHGNAVISELRIRKAMEFAYDSYRMRRELNLALGTAWDDELEPFRYAGEGAPVRWLHSVG